MTSAEKNVSEPPNLKTLLAIMPPVTKDLPTALEFDRPGERSLE